MSLDILQLPECDFVVYSEKDDKPNILIVPVLYTEDFWKEKRERLKRIHRELIVPEFFVYNTIFKRQPIFLVYSPFHEDYDDSYFWCGEEPSNTFTVENENQVLITSETVKVRARVKSEH
ncbi:Serpentine receptor class gamma-8 [Frankliniella fusca]|uniref:Serpentine receptor class gamma-8 n=1 Tax=Frankliniella fusca TaxID=407009 RepID=A0AAE1LPE9_9NEOP|nr:Serpentine receptor class gamma-8 [Frankliniella fusca]